MESKKRNTKRISKEIDFILLESLIMAKLSQCHFCIELKKEKKVK